VVKFLSRKGDEEKYRTEQVAEYQSMKTEIESSSSSENSENSDEEKPTISEHVGTLEIKTKWKRKK